jgi:hypothetical protein
MKNIGPTKKDHKFKIQIKHSENDSWHDLKYERWGHPETNEFNSRMAA